VSRNPALSDLSVSIEDMGDYWLATNHSPDMGIASLGFSKLMWDRDVIAGVMLLSISNARAKKADAERQVRIEEIRSRPHGKRGRPRGK
jgi:hypothetical protein